MGTSRAPRKNAPLFPFPRTTQRLQNLLIKEYTLNIIGSLIWFKVYSLIKGFGSLWVLTTHDMLLTTYYFMPVGRGGGQNPKPEVLRRTLNADTLKLNSEAFSRTDVLVMTWLTSEPLLKVKLLASFLWFI